MWFLMPHLISLTDFLGWHIFDSYTYASITMYTSRFAVKWLENNLIFILKLLSIIFPRNLNLITLVVVVPLPCKISNSHHWKFTNTKVVFCWSKSSQLPTHLRTNCKTILEILKRSSKLYISHSALYRRMYSGFAISLYHL